MMHEIYTAIKEAKRVLIISHINPDGDTLGSMCALKLAIGAKADMLIQGSAYPKMYEFLPEIKKSKFQYNVNEIYDLVITVDVASIDRLLDRARIIFDKCKNTINFDHHKTNVGFAKLNLINPNVSSCGEVLFDYFKKENIKITYDMAICLYTAIITDTGGFRYENTKESTFLMAKELIDLKIDVAKISQYCWENKSKAMVMLHSYCVSNTKFLENDKIAYSIVKNEDLRKFGAKSEHTEGIVETLRSIDSVEIAFIAKEIDKHNTKISLRSKTFDLTELTSKFQGGGHKNSAGCTIKKPIEKAVDALIFEIQKML